MKTSFLFIAGFISLTAQAQDFSKQVATARTAYTAGKLDDSRFAMQQMLQELDIMTGKEIIKLLPQKLDDQAAVASKDNVAGASGWAGVVVHREYGSAAKGMQVEVITNSPLIGSLNALLSLPFVAGNADQKIIKIEGYKALVQKTSGADETAEFELQLPLNNSLITLKAPGYTQEQIIKMGNTLPVAAIAKMVQ